MKLLGSSGSIEGIAKVIAAFYGGEPKELRGSTETDPLVEWTVHRSNGVQIENVRVVLITQRGRSIYRFEHVA